jgi:hypothetical protein
MNAMLGLFGLGVVFGILVWLVLVALGLAATVFWIWMIFHAITNKGISDIEKIIWVLVIFFTHFVGALIYFFVGRPKGVGAFG